MEKEEVKNKFIENVENIIKSNTKKDCKYNDYFETCSATKEIIPILQKINDLFLTTYKLEIKYNDKTITILPVETEIYFSSCKNRECKKNICEQCNNFYDGMIYENERQKNNFGQLYFHRIQYESKDMDMYWGAKSTDPIDLKSGGVDVCISNSDNYYLSILIRSAYINCFEKENLVSGINMICKKIIKKMRKSDECIEYLLKNIEQKNNNVIIERDKNEKMKDKNILHQPRISENHYSSMSTYSLNSIDIENMPNGGFYTEETKKILKQIKNKNIDFNPLFKELKDNKLKSEYLKPKNLVHFLK